MVDMQVHSEAKTCSKWIRGAVKLEKSEMPAIEFNVQIQLEYSTWNLRHCQW